MAKSFNKEYTAILIALTIAALLFLTPRTYAESTVKSTVKINGVEYINDEVVSEESTNSDIDVSVKNGQGTIKYKINGVEKVIQITPRTQTSQNSNSATILGDESEAKTENESKDLKNDESEDDKNNDGNNGPQNEDQKTDNLFEAMKKAIESLFTKLNDLLS